jgi:serine protease Do
VRSWWLASLLVIALVTVAACGTNTGNTGGSGSANENGDHTKGGNTTAEASNFREVSEITDVDEATVFVEAAGGIADTQREVGEFPIFTGTAFIISSDGYAVTANHVVTGAGYLKVYLPGESEPRTASPVGVSECSDLALIKIHGGGYHYLDWQESPVEAGENVWAAGYPEDPTDPDKIPPPYSIIDGTVNQTEANGDTPWSSVESVIMHSAQLFPGYSGGPLLDESAKVVGVNYGLIQGSEDDATRNLAISQEQAEEIVNHLKDGDYESLGVNGEAVAEDPETGFKGFIRVNSVKTGSPAQEVGIRGITQNPADGHYTMDFITKLEGTDLAKNGTMQEYCDILRGAGSNAPLSVEVWRVDVNDPDTYKVLTGTLNDENGKLKEQT